MPKTTPPYTNKTTGVQKYLNSNEFHLASAGTNCRPDFNNYILAVIPDTMSHEPSINGFNIEGAPLDRLKQNGVDSLGLGLVVSY